MKIILKIIVLTTFVGLQGCYDREDKKECIHISNIKKQEATSAAKKTRTENEHIPLKGDLLQVIYVSSF